MAKLLFGTIMEHILVPKVDHVKLVDRLNYSSPDVGTLYLTPSHVIFNDTKNRKEHWILLMHVSSVEKLPTSASGCPLFIKCKHFLHITFIIPKEKDALDVYISLNQLSQPTKISDLYCFYYKPPPNEILEKAVGWSYFELESEYNRFLGTTKNWVRSYVNDKYQICSTYPSKLYVPQTADNECLKESAKFRSKGRLPVLSYLYTNEAAICRCSQPLSGFNNRSPSDESLLEAILNANPNHTKELYIVDTRPKINAMANRAAGKGYENEQYYLNAKFHFLAIENIHVMRASLNKLLDSCDIKPPISNYLSNIESSHWLKHVKSLLETSHFIATSIRDGISVLVHCSDGWDRTAQACSLSSILLDPYYRTMRGFQALISKEWLSFGHKFSDRCGHILSDLRETAPVFTQFLDAVWQIWSQYPTEFEFNENFLITLNDHVYSCQFGTFIGNCERERDELKLAERTFSLWAFLNGHPKDYLNALYCPETIPLSDTTSSSSSSSSSSINNGGGNREAQERRGIMINEDPENGCNHKYFLEVDSSPQRLKFWLGLYNRHEHLVHPRESYY